MLVTPAIEHLIRFVYEGSKESDPEAGKEDTLITPDSVLLTELMEIKKSEPEEDEIAEEPALTRTGSSRQSSKTRKRAMSVVMRKQVTKKGIKIKGAALRLIAKAIEGSEEERKLAGLERKVALKRLLRCI